MNGAFVSSKANVKKKISEGVIPSNDPCFDSRKSQMSHMGMRLDFTHECTRVTLGCFEWSLLVAQQMKPPTHQDPLFFSVVFFLDILPLSH